MNEIQEAKSFCMDTQSHILASFKQQRIRKIAKILPRKENFNTGPQSSAFSLLEDMIILVCSSSYGRQELFGRDSEKLDGNVQALPFWEKVICFLSMKRSADALRSRYARIVSQVHPREYDQYLDLMTKGQFDAEIKYSTHPTRKFMVIRKVCQRDFSSGLCDSFQLANKRNQVINVEEFSQSLKNDDRRTNYKSSEYRYLTSEFLEEREVIEQLVKNPKYNEQRSIVYDWIDTAQITLAQLKNEISSEVSQVNKDILELEILRKQVHLDEIPQKTLEQAEQQIEQQVEQQVVQQVVSQQVHKEQRVQLEPAKFEQKQEMNIFGELVKVIDIDDDFQFQ